MAPSRARRPSAWPELGPRTPCHRGPSFRNPYTSPTVASPGRRAAGRSGRGVLPRCPGIGHWRGPAPVGGLALGTRGRSTSAHDRSGGRRRRSLYTTHTWSDELLHSRPLPSGRCEEFVLSRLLCESPRCVAHARLGVLSPEPLFLFAAAHAYRLTASASVGPNSAPTRRRPSQSDRRGQERSDPWARKDRIPVGKTSRIWLTVNTFSL